MAVVSGQARGYRVSVVPLEGTDSHANGIVTPIYFAEGRTEADTRAHPCQDPLHWHGEISGSNSPAETLTTQCREDSFTEPDGSAIIATPAPRYYPVNPERSDYQKKIELHLNSMERSTTLCYGVE